MIGQKGEPLLKTFGREFPCTAARLLLGQRRLPQHVSTLRYVFEHISAKKKKKTIRKKFHCVAWSMGLSGLWTLVMMFMCVYVSKWSRVRLRHCPNFKRDASCRDVTGRSSEHAERDRGRETAEDEEEVSWRHTGRTTGYLWVTLFTAFLVPTDVHKADLKQRYS